MITPAKGEINNTLTLMLLLRLIFNQRKQTKMTYLMWLKML